MKKSVKTAVLFAFLLIIDSLAAKEAVDMLTAFSAALLVPHITLLGGLPMYFVVAILFCLTFLLIDIAAKGVRSRMIVKRVMRAICVLAMLGMASSVFVGLFVYHSFFESQVLWAYPFVMLVFHAVSFTAAAILFARENRIIKRAAAAPFIPKPSRKLRLKFFGYSTLMIFSLSLLGSLIKLPLYLSAESRLAIPFFLQLAVPAAELLLFMIHKLFVSPARKKALGIVSTITLLSITLITFTLNAIAYIKEPITFVSVISPFLMIERLLHFPLCYALIYSVSLFLPAANLIVMAVREKRVRRKKRAL